MKPNLQNVNLQISAGFASQFPKTPLPHIVFLGRSNVGKSSLINALLGRKSLARVSSAPGKTITINFYNIDNKLFFVDLPGYGYAKRSRQDQQVWSALTDSYVTSGENQDRLYLSLIDCKTGATKDDLMMLDWLSRSEIPYFIIATKCDKPNKTDRAKTLAKLEMHGVVVEPFSALTGEGRDEIWSQLNRFLSAETVETEP